MDTVRVRLKEDVPGGNDRGNDVGVLAKGARVEVGVELASAWARKDVVKLDYDCKHGEGFNRTNSNGLACCPICLKGEAEHEAEVAAALPPEPKADETRPTKAEKLSDK